MLVRGPRWLRAHPLVTPALRALRLDLDPEVAAVLDPGSSPGAVATDAGRAPEPVSEGRPGGVVVLAERATIRRPHDGLDDPWEPLRSEDLCVRDASFHVRAGEHLGIVAGEEAAATGLLRTLAGFAPAGAGRLDVGGPAVLVADPGHVVEPTLSVRENVALLAGYVGGHVGATYRRADDLADRAGLEVDLDLPLGAVPAAGVARLIVAVALECADAPLLLFDELPSLGDAEFARWAGERAAERCRDGIAIVEASAGRTWALGPPDRVLWLEDAEVVTCGHAESVLDALRCRQLGLAAAT
jgi:ABC-type polysaccharide/polyol phosphate transport system ATPase subunit